MEASPAEFVTIAVSHEFRCFPVFHMKPPPALRFHVKEFYRISDKMINMNNGRIPRNSKLRIAFRVDDKNENDFHVKSLPPPCGHHHAVITTRSPPPFKHHHAAITTRSSPCGCHRAVITMRSPPRGHHHAVTTRGTTGLKKILMKETSCFRMKTLRYLVTFRISYENT